MLKRDLFQPLVSGYDPWRLDAMSEIVDRAHEAAAIGLGRPALIRFARKIMPRGSMPRRRRVGIPSEPQAPVIAGAGH